MKASELSKKQVVSVRDDKIMGRIVDFELDPKRFQIEAVCVQKKPSFFIGWLCDYFVESKVVVDVEQIVSIGTDIVLMENGHNEKRGNKLK